MNVNSLVGVYDSGYSMLEDDVPRLYSDRIQFTYDPETDSFTGSGHPDSDGFVMRLTLREDGENILGRWREQDVGGTTSYEGDVTFFREDEKLIGEWKMENERGIWVLVKRLGSQALAD